MTGDPLQLHEMGTYGDLVGRPNPEGFVVITTPPIEGLLMNLIERLGRDLSRDEIEAELDKAWAVAATANEADKMFAARARGMAESEEDGGGRFTPVVLPAGTVMVWTLQAVQDGR